MYKKYFSPKATLSLKMIMTELPIDMFNNKRNSKSRGFKTQQQIFKRQQKKSEQKAIKPVTKELVKQSKPKQPKMPTKQKAENKDIQNMLDETYEGEEDAYILLEEIAIQLRSEAYKAYLEELDELYEKFRMEEMEKEFQRQWEKKKNFEDDFDLEDNYNFWEGYEEYESEDKIRNPHLYA
jgi:hypothetical protein